MWKDQISQYECQYLFSTNMRNILYNCSTFQLGSFEILTLALSIADFNTSPVITWDLCTLGRIGRNFRAASYRRAIYVIRGWIVGIWSAMNGIPCADFHVPYFAYQGTLHQTRLIRLAIRGTEAQGERNREKLITRKHTELLSCVWSACETNGHVSAHKCVS